MSADPLLRVVDLRPADLDPNAQVGFSSWRISFELQPREHVAVLGATGVGKTALLRTLVRLQRSVHGQVWFEARDITRLEGGALRALRRHLQYVGGDPRDAFPPGVTVGQAIREALEIHRIGSASEQTARVETAAALLGLNHMLLDRLPGSLSSGLRQRAALARAMVLQPRLLVCDALADRLEPAAARPLLRTLAHACRVTHTAWLWATADPEAARLFSDRVLRLADGQLVPEPASTPA